MAYGALQAYFVDCVSETQSSERDALGMLRQRDICMAVEDFGMPSNLMFRCSAVLVHSEEEGIAVLAAMLSHGPASSRKGSFDS